MTVDHLGLLLRHPLGGHHPLHLRWSWTLANGGIRARVWRTSRSSCVGHFLRVTNIECFNREIYLLNKAEALWYNK